MKKLNIAEFLDKKQIRSKNCGHNRQYPGNSFKSNVHHHIHNNSSNCIFFLKVPNTKQPFV